MAYTEPPTFADGDILSASQLNILSDNQEYLKGVLDAPNTPFLSLSTAAAGVDAPTTNYWFRHTLQYFHWYFLLVSDVIDRVRIRIYAADGNLQFGAAIIDDTSTPADQTEAIAAGWVSSYDVSALTIGTYYRAQVEIEASGSGQAYLVYMGEKATA